jgi:hypothetical protein
MPATRTRSFHPSRASGPPGQWHGSPPGGPRWGNVPSKSSTRWAAWLSYKAASISVPDPQQQPVSPSPPPERARRCTPTARAGRVTPGLDHTGLNRPTPPLRHTDLPMRPRRGSAGCSTRGRRASVAPRESGLYPDSRPAWHHKFRQVHGGRLSPEPCSTGPNRCRPQVTAQGDDRMRDPRRPTCGALHRGCQTPAAGPGCASFAQACGRGPTRSNCCRPSPEWGRRSPR